MNTEQGFGAVGKEAGAPQPANAYEAPVLTPYGAIHHATQGTGTMAAEGGGGMSMMA